MQLRSIFLFVSLWYLSEPNKTRLIIKFSLSWFMDKSFVETIKEFRSFNMIIMATQEKVLSWFNF